MPGQTKEKILFPFGTYIQFGKQPPTWSRQHVLVLDICHCHTGQYSLKDMWIKHPSAPIAIRLFYKLSCRCHLQFVYTSYIEACTITLFTQHNIQLGYWRKLQ